MRSRGITERAAVIVGVAPIRSARQARYLERLPGVTVPPAMLAELEDAGDDAERLGTSQCVDIVTRLREMQGIAGVHVMGLGREEAVRHVIEQAGLLPQAGRGGRVDSRHDLGKGADMAETVTIDGQPYLKRNPLGVLGLSFITIGIYGLYWYYKINQELQRFERDDTISPSRSLVALFPGGIIIVPAIIAVYNTGLHIQKAEQRLGVQSQISPALLAILVLVFSIALGPYAQEHMNRIWDAGSMAQGRPASLPRRPGGPPPPPPPVG